MLEANQAGNEARAFPKTQWSVVLQAGKEDGRAALARLCEAYWYPVYSFLRAKGASPDRASDLTQSFFTFLIEGEEIKRADPERGRFRSFLRTAAKHFYMNAIDHERRQKRGGDLVRLSIDVPGAESRLSRELMHTLTPDRLFDRAWAKIVTERARREFREHCACPEDLALLERACAELSGEGHASEPERTSASGKPRTVAERVRKHRHRERVLAAYRRCLRREILGTLEDSSAIDAEIRYLIDVTR
jgi:RNA polymerase sigma-70 factor (ECF subfamily)